MAGRCLLRLLVLVTSSCHARAGAGRGSDPAIADDTSLDGWSSTGPPLKGISHHGVLVENSSHPHSWHFVAPTTLIASASSLLGARLSYNKFYAPIASDASGHRCDLSDLYEVVLFRSRGGDGGVAAMGARSSQPIHESTQSYTWWLNSSIAWENVESGEKMGASDVKVFMDQVGGILVRGNRYGASCAERVRLYDIEFLLPPTSGGEEKPSSAPASSARRTETASLEGCDLLYREKDWSGALRCYREWRTHADRSSPARGSVRERQRACWAQLREARLALMLSKPAKEETWKTLSAALHAADEEDGRPGGHEDGGAGREAWGVGLSKLVEAGTCTGWCYRTRGDVLFKDRDYKAAAVEYEKALHFGLGDVLSVAVTRHDLAAAQHLSQEEGADFTRLYSEAVNLEPELVTSQISGTMGTFAYPEDARVIIQKALHQRYQRLSRKEETRSSRLKQLDEHIRREEGAFPACSSNSSRRVHFFCRIRGQTPGTADQRWGPSSTQRGVGGSEEAAIYLVRELARKGWCVRVYGNPEVEEWGRDEDGVTWLPFYTLDMLQEPSVFVVWRNFDAVWLAPRTRSRFLWVHDPLALASDQDYFTSTFLGALSGIFVLSQHSASQFPPHAQSKLILSNNGLAPHLLRDGPNHHHKLLYSSWPSSGLEQLLELWPRIRHKAGGGELYVYYGFDMWWATPLYKHERWFIEWRRKMEDMLRQEGVKYMGGVGHQDMADAYAEAGFYVYPTDTPETAPINLIKAQANGCVPVTSRYPLSAIPETTGEFDLGPEPGSHVSIKQNRTLLLLWADAVARAVATPREELEEHRRRMKRSARERYSWPKIAEEWSRHFSKAVGEREGEEEEQGEGGRAGGAGGGGSSDTGRAQ